MRVVRIRNARSGALLAERAELCASVWSRFWGLMLRRSLAPGHGIVLSPCGSIHTALMRFAIDVVYLDEHGRVVKLVQRLRPYRVSFGGRRARSTIELPAGALADAQVRLGDELVLEQAVGHPATA